MIPYIEIPVYKIGPIPLDPWGTLVCIGFVLGLEMARARGIKMGLQVQDVVDGIVAIVGSGFVIGHVVHVVAYHPEQLESDGIMALLRVWAGLSSMGGFLGAVIGAAVFYGLIRKRPFLPHADAVMYGLPFGWLFGRLGCFAAHDHIGRPSTSFLAVKFPGGPRFDLGLLEALWTMVICAAFLLAARSPRRPGFFLALWCAMYAPVRFGLDFLRNTDLKTADVRWFGLTPAQYGAMLMAVVGVALVIRLRKPPVPAPDTVPSGDPASGPPEGVQ